MVTDMRKHYRKIRITLLVILVLNWAVAAAKIIYGLLTRCESMTADGFHSLSDGASNIVGLIGIHFACQPIDKDHPYGHKKYETFFSLGIAVLLFILAFNLARGSIMRLNNPDLARVDITSFIIMLATMAVNILVMNYERKKGKLLQSDILISDAMHTRGDIFTSFSVLISLILIKAGFSMVDHIVTFIISLFIAHAGYEIIKQGQAVLCDTAAFLDDHKIKDIVLKISGVRACHKIRSRGRIDDIYIDLHVQVDPDMHIDNAHRISYRIEETIKSEIPGITDVVVHMEPKEN